MGIWMAKSLTGRFYHDPPPPPNSAGWVGRIIVAVGAETKRNKKGGDPYQDKESRCGTPGYTCP